MRKFTALVCLLWSGVLVSMADTHYVSLDGTNDVDNGYTTWAGAATQIQWSVSAAGYSDTVLVSNGTYNLTNEIRIGVTTISVKSLNGPDHTFVNGNNYDGKLVTNRCFNMSLIPGTIAGFTISNGYTTGGGAGVYMDTGGLVSNCIIRGNVDSGGGGGGVEALGVYGGSVIANCIIVSNFSTVSGGGLNITAWGGNHQYVKNCLIYDNTCSSGGGNGGGIVTFQNNPCTNFFINCTIAANSGRGIFMTSSTGSKNSLFLNCIIYTNKLSGSTWQDFWPAATNDVACFWYSASSGLPADLAAGQDNIIANPLFVDHASRNYRLNNNSPCVNTGTNQDWTANSVDLDGLTRIRYGRVDMGAYELIYSGTIYCFH